MTEEEKIRESLYAYADAQAPPQGIAQKAVAAAAKKRKSVKRGFYAWAPALLLVVIAVAVLPLLLMPKANLQPPPSGSEAGYGYKDVYALQSDGFDGAFVLPTELTESGYKQIEVEYREYRFLEDGKIAFFSQKLRVQYGNGIDEIVIMFAPDNGRNGAMFDINGDRETVGGIAVTASRTREDGEYRSAYRAKHESGLYRLSATSPSAYADAYLSALIDSWDK